MYNCRQLKWCNINLYKVVNEVFQYLVMRCKLYLEAVDESKINLEAIEEVYTIP